MPPDPHNETAPPPPTEGPPPSAANDAPDLFAPSILRFLFVLALAVGAFFIPQEIALEWYPLNEPGNDIHYLETTLRTSNTGNIRFVYDCGFGFVEPYTITIPVAPSDMAFTYTFPLPDAPLRKLFIDPPDAPGELEFTRLRIINRREEEVRNFSPDEFKISPGLQQQPTLHGWKLVADDKTAFDAGADVDFLPVRPVGMTLRNVKRCLLSWSYLSFMLWLITLAIYFVFLSHRRGKDILRATAFLLLICAMMSVVGNRGLIRNTYRISNFKPVKVPPGHTLEFEIASAQPGEVRLISTAAASDTEPQTTTVALASHPDLQTVRFPLKDGVPLAQLKLQLPPGTVKLMPPRLLDGGKYTVVELPIADFGPSPETIARTTAGRPFLQLPPEHANRDFALSADSLRKISARLTAPPRVTP